jgi:hypothetical protein
VRGWWQVLGKIFEQKTRFQGGPTLAWSTLVSNSLAHLFICWEDLFLSFSFDVMKRAVAAIVNNSTAIITKINTKITFCISFRLFINQSLRVHGRHGKNFPYSKDSVKWLTPLKQEVNAG